MKKLLIILLAVMGITTITYAQGNNKGKSNKKTAEERAKKSSERMEKELNFTVEQKNKIYELNLARAKKIDELRAKYGDDRKAIGKEMKPINMERKNQLMQILDKEQQEKHKAFKEKQKKLRAEKGGKGKGNGKGKGKNKGKIESAPENSEIDEDEEFED
jgi:periplasmic protein CpxP/Spy